MKIDFYLVKTTEKQATWTFACKLIEKAYELGHHIFVLLDTKQEALAFDELLWEFNPSSFIPHHIQGEGPTPPPPEQISYQIEKKPTQRDIFINLSHQVPNFFQEFKRICEFVFEDEALKKIKREHYKFYQGHQYHIDTHHINQ
jgi:DNA polymerase-3 subunit chi